MNITNVFHDVPLDIVRSDNVRYPHPLTLDFPFSPHFQGDLQNVQGRFRVMRLPREFEHHEVVDFIKV